MACRAAPLMESLSTPDGCFDRSAIMRRAHKELADWRRMGDPQSWSWCLKAAWDAARYERATLERKAAARFAPS